MYYILYFGELILKKKNQSQFKKKLADNIKKTLESFGYKHSLSNYENRFLLKIEENKQQEKIKNILIKIPGIAVVRKAIMLERDISFQKLTEDIVHHLKEKEIHTFRVSVKRLDKTYQKNSDELARDCGAEVLKKYPQLKVNLTQYDQEIYIEIAQKYIFICFEKNKGSCGLPVGSSGKVLSLLSGGIDSPVASYLMMKRGLDVTLIHFHSFPQTSLGSLEKVKTLAKKLSIFHNTRISLIMVPFLEVQNAIATLKDISYRTVLLKHLMLLYSQEEALKTGRNGIITGDSLAQVASQTLGNMKCIQENIDIPLLQPLIGMDKTYITKQAYKIDTYETSIIPHEDCCHLFTPQKPILQAHASTFKSLLEQLPIQKLFQHARDKQEILTIATNK
jgi:tRNA uracil 4-sulfurtransferase